MVLARCSELRNWLNCLPSGLPECNRPDFQSFDLQDVLDDDRGLTGSLNYFLESIFNRGKAGDEGQKERVVDFDEKGPGLLAVVDSQGGKMKRHPVVKWRDIDEDIFFRRSKAIAEVAEEGGLGDQSDDSSTEEESEGNGVITDVPATEFIVEEP